MEQEGQDFLATFERLTEHLMESLRGRAGRIA